MLADASATSTFTVDDLDTADRFYRERLGLRTRRIGELGLMLDLIGGGRVFVYPKGDGHRPADSTVLAFEVDDVERAVAALSDADVEVLRYDDPNLPQDALGIYRGTQRGDGPDIAWFRDPAGNTLSVESGAWAGSTASAESAGSAGSAA
jgi:catechol 2,3-dioxygenase-like lactoylglutathione lyase family enzyme